MRLEMMRPGEAQAQAQAQPDPVTVRPAAHLIWKNEAAFSIGST